MRVLVCGHDVDIVQSKILINDISYNIIINEFSLKPSTYNVDSHLLVICIAIMYTKHELIRLILI